MDLAEFVFTLAVVLLNAGIMFFISYSIARWMKRTDRKIDKIYRQVRESEMLSKTVYDVYLEQLAARLIRDEKFEQVVIVKEQQNAVLKSLLERMKEEEGKSEKGAVNKGNGI